MKSSKFKVQSSKLRIKSGDLVRILRGKDRGKTGKILGVFPKKGRVLVEGIQMVFKHVRPRRAGEKGQRVQVASPVPAAKVQLVCPHCKKSARVGIRREDDTRVRFCKQCKEIL